MPHRFGDMLASLPGSSTAAFAVVFGIFMVALVVLVVWVAIWAIRRDSAGRRRWEAERSEADEPDVPSV